MVALLQALVRSHPGPRNGPAMPSTHSLTPAPAQAASRRNADLCGRPCRVLSMREPGWPLSFDADPGQAARSSVRILDMLATDRMQVMGYHFTFPGIGHVSRDGSTFRYVPESLRQG